MAAKSRGEGTLHAGHRERLRSRFLENGLDTMENHVALELLLFYSIPRGDTNPIAHRLIEKFGSLSAALDAPYEELLETEGIGPSSALLLKLIPELCRRYHNGAAVRSGLCRRMAAAARGAVRRGRGPRPRLQRCQLPDRLYRKGRGGAGRGDGG